MLLKSRLIQFVVNENCPNYFVVRNNMFEGRFTSDSKKELLGNLYKLLSSGWLWILQSKSLYRFLDFIQGSKSQLELLKSMAIENEKVKSLNILTKLVAEEGLILSSALMGLDKTSKYNWKLRYRLSQFIMKLYLNVTRNDINMDLTNLSTVACSVWPHLRKLDFTVSDFFILLKAYENIIKQGVHPDLVSDLSGVPGHFWTNINDIMKYLSTIIVSQYITAVSANKRQDTISGDETLRLPGQNLRTHVVQRPWFNVGSPEPPFSAAVSTFYTLSTTFTTTSSKMVVIRKRKAFLSARFHSGKRRQHKRNIQFCKCEPEAVTLVKYRLWPSTTKFPKLAFDMELLKWLYGLLIECHVSCKGFCEALKFRSSKYQRNYVNFQECNDFQAGNHLRSKNKNKKLAETAVFGSTCRHEFPKYFFSLKHGER
ncbi:unnamed protein product [Mytilus edulis]|uniref:CxC1-like cysteine cluster associated with KDZ transposases domain-containing protein n=1 Tax=Mytilus edulis TaxID=6550 RepID=A0A8S3TER8_MYTED|nr:unnamed protein product [Mytilus edulis]